MSEIGNDQLSAINVPDPLADQSEIEAFALSFDADSHWGSLEKCAEIARSPKRDDLTELRTALYFQQRKMRWNTGLPGTDTLQEMRRLVAAIRELVGA